MQPAAKRIIQVQRSYFSLLKDYFGQQHAEVTRLGGDSERYLRGWLMGQAEKDVIYKMRRCLEDIEGFWSIQYQDLRTSITSLDFLPVYTVSRPMYLAKQIASAGLYVDTIVCHDDFISGLRNFDVETINKTQLAVGLLRDLLDLLSLESCFVADLEFPLAVVCPGERDFNIDTEIQLINQSLQLVTNFANELLDSNHSDWQEVVASTGKVVGSRAIKEAIKRMELLPAPFREPKNGADRLSQCFERMRHLQRQVLLPWSKQPILKDLLVSFLTPMGVLEGQLHGSLELDLAPLFPRYVWDLYKWRAHRGSVESARALGWEERHTSAIATAFQHESLDWLGNIPLSGIIELREQGFMEDFRQRIRVARKRLAIEEGLDFANVAQKVNEQIELAIAEHVDSVTTLEREVHKRLKSEGAKYLEKVSLGIAAFICWPIAVFNLVKETGAFITDVVKTRKLGCPQF